MKILIFVAILFIFAGYSECRRRLWTEEDEAKYLQDLKERELKEFELEMRAQSDHHGSRVSAPYHGSQAAMKSTFESSDLPVELRPKTTKKLASIPKHEALRLPKDEIQTVEGFSNNEDVFGDDENWCYYCATPIDKLRPDMRKSIRNLLEMRRTTFPLDAVTTECLSARNLTKLKKQKCSYKYCQSLSILDRNAGNAFVVRGCAEHFGAINVPELEKKADHSCQMLHEKLEIKECICKTEKYCNAGWTKRFANSSFQKSYIIMSTVYLFFVILF